MMKGGRLLRYEVFGVCIGAIGVVAILLIRALTEEAIAPICEIEISMELPTDIAQPFGSIFEISDQNGNLIASAFVPQTSSLFHRSEGRHASFFVKGEAGTLPSPRVLGRPSQHSPCSTLFTLQGELFATTRAKLNTSADLKVLKDGVWQTVTEPQGLSRAGLQFAIPLQGALLVASDRGVEWGDVRVFTPPPGLEQKYFYHYSSGFLVAYEYGDTDAGVLSRLTVFKWVPGDPPVANSSAVLTESLPIDYPLCFGELDRNILFTTNSSGRVYAIDLDSARLKCIFEKRSGTAWQGYCMTRYFDRLLIGQYPSGQMFETDGRAVRPFHASLPLTQDWSWELQSTGFLYGQLLAGVWPWGQMYQFDGNSWRLLGRCFNEPPIANIEAPFNQESVSSGQEANSWGQRVNTMVHFTNSLFVATMNKTGTRQGEEAVGEGSLRYGSVLQFPVESHLDWSIRWGKRMTLVFRIWQDHAEIYQDDSLVASGVGDFTAITKADRMRWGSGIAGDFVGQLTATRLSVERQQGR